MSNVFKFLNAILTYCHRQWHYKFTAIMMPVTYVALLYLINVSKMTAFSFKPVAERKHLNFKCRDGYPEIFDIQLIKSVRIRRLI